MKPDLVAEEQRGYAGYFLTLLVDCSCRCERGGRSHALELGRVAGLTHPASEKSDIGPLAAAEGVQFVENQEPGVLRVWVPDTQSRAIRRE